jgi:hypothetical protein
MNEQIYINGKLHNCEWDSTTVMFADDPALPRRRCSQHTFKPGSRRHLESGGSVITGGNHYSKRKPTVVETLIQPVIPEDDTADVYDNITQWLAYGIGALMAFVMFCLAIGYVVAKLGL